MRTPHAREKEVVVGEIMMVLSNTVGDCCPRRQPCVRVVELEIEREGYAP